MKISWMESLGWNKGWCEKIGLAMHELGGLATTPTFHERPFPSAQQIYSFVARDCGPILIGAAAGIAGDTITVGLKPVHQRILGINAVGHLENF